MADDPRRHHSTGRSDPGRPRPGSSVRRPVLTVGRLFGVPVVLNPSVAVFAVVVAVLYGEFVHRRLELSPPVGYVVGFGFVGCLLGSVLLHELGHALTARRYGIGVRGITLELLGGYTELDRDAPSPRVDLLVALAGPAVSLLLGGVAVVATLLLPDRTLTNQLAFQLAVSNLLVAVFNSLPGLPLDGGRALRAVVWALTRDRHRGTGVAGWAGRVVAVVTASGALVLTWAGVLQPLGLALSLLVVLTLWRGAGQSLRVARMARRFPLIELPRLARPVFAVPAGTPLAEAERRLRADGGPTAVLAVADTAGRLTAVVDPVAARSVPEPRRPWVAVQEVARDLAGLPSLAAGLTGAEVIEAVQAHPGAQYVVRAGEDVLGILLITDLAQLLEPNRKMTQ